MKLYEIQSINEQHNPNKVMGMELRFTHSICSTSGKNYPAEKQPDDWQHVRRLTHMLFLAWNDDNPVEPVVYLGELYDSESEDEKFYKFFERFNKFPINDKQKSMYSSIKNGGHTSGSRRCGATVLLLTMAAYESIINNNFVVYFAHNSDTANLYQKKFRHNWCYMPCPYKHPDDVKFKTLNCDMSIFRGRSNARVFFDNSWMFSDQYPYKKYKQFDEYHHVTKPISDFKQYSIDTY